MSASAGLLWDLNHWTPIGFITASWYVSRGKWTTASFSNFVSAHLSMSIKTAGFYVWSGIPKCTPLISGHIILLANCSLDDPCFLLWNVACVCELVCGCGGGGQGFTAGIFLCHLSYGCCCYFETIISHWVWGLLFGLEWLANYTASSAHLCPQPFGHRFMPPQLVFYMCAGDPNPGPHDSAASTLPTESFL